MAIINKQVITRIKHLLQYLYGYSMSYHEGVEKEVERIRNIEIKQDNRHLVITINLSV